MCQIICQPFIILFVILTLFEFYELQILILSQMNHGKIFFHCVVLYLCR